MFKIINGKILQKKKGFFFYCCRTLSLLTRRNPPSPPPNISIPTTNPNLLFSIIPSITGIVQHFFTVTLLNWSTLIQKNLESKFWVLQSLTNLSLVDFITHKQPYYLELVQVFYNNMHINDDRVIYTKVKKVRMTITPSLFYSLTNIHS